MLHLPQTEWDEGVIRAAYFCQPDILKNMLYLNPDAVYLMDEGLLLAEFPLANYSEGNLSMEKGAKRPTLKKQADTLEVILRAMGKQKSGEPIYRIKTIDELPYGKKGEHGMVFDSCGNTILHMIAFYEGSHFLPVLRKVGLDISALAHCKNSKNQTPIDIALNVMANMPLAFAIQEQVMIYEREKMKAQLKRIQRENIVLREQLTDIKACKIMSWSVSGMSNFSDNFVNFKGV